MPKVGLEPTIPSGNTSLSRARLPVPPLRPAPEFYHNKRTTKGGDAAVVESVKAASEVYAPVTGEVVDVNKELEGDPALVNRGAEGDGWFMKVKLSNPAELSELMDKAAYDKFVASL